MDFRMIKAENVRLIAENVRLLAENARLAVCLRDARELVQLLEKETRPHSIPSYMPHRSRLFSSSSTSPDTKEFLRKCSENMDRNGSVSLETSGYFGLEEKIRHRYSE